MIINNEKGFGLPLVIIIFTVLVVLVTSLLTIAINEVRQSSDYHHQTQAYYYARSGIEYLLNGNIDTDTIKDLSESKGEFSDFGEELNNMGIEKLTFGYDDSENIVVESTGISNKVKDTIKITIMGFSPGENIPDIPDTPENINVPEASNQGWTAGNSGNISHFNNTQVPVSPPDAEQIQFSDSSSVNPQGNNKKHSFKVDEFYFKKDLDIKHGGILELIGNLTVFYDEVTINEHPGGGPGNNAEQNDGKLCLKKKDNRDHFVYFEYDLNLGDNVLPAGTYKLPENENKICLTPDNDEYQELIEIDSDQGGFTYEKLKWSK